MRMKRIQHIGLIKVMRKGLMTVNGSPSIISSGINGMPVVRYSEATENIIVLEIFPTSEPFSGYGKIQVVTILCLAMITDTTSTGKVTCLIIPMHRQMSEMVIYD